MNKLTDFKLLKFLNQGAQGKCYLYENIKDSLKQKVVLKEIQIKNNSNLSEEQNKEIEILKNCRHPFIIGLYGHFVENLNLYIIMQYAEGGSLGNEIYQRKVAIPQKHFDEFDIFMYFTQITLALNYLHSQNVIHCDLKPENILLNGSKKLAKLADFGISKIIENGENVKCEKGREGTPFYIPPEIWNGQKYSNKIDIWSLGCILYEMCELKKSFNGSTVDVITYNVIFGKYEKPLRILNDDLKTIIVDCLNINPENRPTTIQLLKLPSLLISTAKVMCLVNL
uniref:Protein kinase domain-containing protein n=1 Tax=Panagrolaimus sp. PS1159 TaxID=55785 RepID=A0AC35GHS0_9BILA